MKTPLALALAAATLFAVLPSEAAVVHSDYTHLGSTRWVVDFTVVNDGAPSVISNFTIDLPGFSDLALVSHPSAWDTLLIGPDLALGDPGFLDALAILPADELTLGQLIDGFRVEFTYMNGTPTSLPFVISDSSFTVLFSGMTAAAVIPEPGSALLGALGLFAFGALRSRRTGNLGQQAALGKEVTA